MHDVVQLNPAKSITLNVGFALFIPGPAGPTSKGDTDIYERQRLDYCVQLSQCHV